MSNIIKVKFNGEQHGINDTDVDSLTNHLNTDKYIGINSEGTGLKAVDIDTQLEDLQAQIKILQYGYENAEYIDSDDGAVIDCNLPDWNPNNYRVEAEILVNNKGNNDWPTLFGACNGPYETGAYGYVLSKNDSSVYVRHSGWGVIIPNAYTEDTWTKVTLICKDGEQKLRYNDFEGTTHYTGVPATLPSPYLFAFNQQGNVYYNMDCKARRVKIYSDETLVRFFKPAFDRATNTFGMYDLLSDDFFTSIRADKPFIGKML